MTLPPEPLDFTRRLALAGLIGAALPGAARAQAGGIGVRQTSPEGIARTLLQSVTLADGRDFRLILDEFPGGVVVPIHHHPVPGLNYVLSGEAESQYAGEPPRRLRAGDSFVDRAETPHRIFRNLSRTTSVFVLLSFVAEPGQAFFMPGG